MRSKRHRMICLNCQRQYKRVAIYQGVLRELYGTCKHCPCVMLTRVNHWRTMSPFIKHAFVSVAHGEHERYEALCPAAKKSIELLAVVTKLRRMRLARENKR